MKGIEKAVFVLISIIVVIVLVGIYLYFGGYYIFAWALPQAKENYYITLLCPEWVQNKCTKASATELKITVDEEEVSLYDLCTKAYGDEATSQDKWWTGCKELCKGCQ